MPGRTEKEATKHDILNVVLQMTILGRALVANGALRKTDIYAQIDEVFPAMDDLIKVELKSFRAAVDKWPEPTRQ
jgi:hypothetical protein